MNDKTLIFREISIRIIKFHINLHLYTPPIPKEVRLQLVDDLLHTITSALNITSEEYTEWYRNLPEKEKLTLFMAISGYVNISIN